MPTTATQEAVRTVVFQKDVTAYAGVYGVEILRAAIELQLVQGEVVAGVMPRLHNTSTVVSIVSLVDGVWEECRIGPNCFYDNLSIQVITTSLKSERLHTVLQRIAGDLRNEMEFCPVGF